MYDVYRVGPAIAVYRNDGEVTIYDARDACTTSGVYVYTFVSYLTFNVV